MSWDLVVGFYLGGLVVVVLVKVVAICDDSDNISGLFAWDSGSGTALSISLYPLLVIFGFAAIIVHLFKRRKEIWRTKTIRNI